MNLLQQHIAIVGLGYVGLPLAVEFARRYKVTGYDINSHRVESLRQGIDTTFEVEKETLLSVAREKERERGVLFSSDESCLEACSVYIITVPTPINKFKSPDLSPLLTACQAVGRYLKKGNLVVFESTVYPGCTEEDCVPVLEQESGLVYNKDFFCGYSPERINPGDKVNTLTSIRKVTSGSTPEVAEWVDSMYASIITAGTHQAPSIKVAEASKAIENAQRDLNISFMNELSLIFDKMEIDTTDVLEAASSKWNFLRFKPGLVGGHCIGVDPYYLTHKAQQLGYTPQVILSGRSVNDGMGEFVARKMVKLMIANDVKIKSSKVLVLGVTFKENCPDIRNTKVVEVYHELVSFGLVVDVYDPWADANEVKEKCGIDLLPEILPVEYQGIILAVAHDEFLALDYASYTQKGCVVFDTKSVIDRQWVAARL